MKKDKKVLFMYDYTGIMAKPWLDEGYTCYCVDGQHPEGVTTGDNPNHIKIGMWINCENIDFRMIRFIVGPRLNMIFGFPECTDLAVSGAAHFKKKAAVNPDFQKRAMDHVRFIEMLGNKFNCPWALENPVSVISSMWRKPDFKFHPYEYGGYLPEDDTHPLYPEYIKPRDAYPKKTCIWSGNGFIEPVKKPVFCGPGYSDQHKKLGGKSLKTKNIRSCTPRGFSKAVFEANKHEAIQQELF